MYEAAGYGREEIGGKVALVVFGYTTDMPYTAFLLCFHLFSRPELLEKVREKVKGKEVEGLQDCRLMKAAWLETLRVCTSAHSVREVVSDTVVDGFLFKKGAMVMGVSRTPQTAPEMWGAEPEK
ncbi:Similar to hypothetical protein AOL_s00076g400 [Arthrobotrys oligospora ATCC 24927]; acc. no. EGX50049 [Pyronema omphalodes CBS 100304]|uniref:Uncharacterized protein n=1 Tax=Pyronema omphalodes (strain CBS 100304) TaxID=1076935 RepID=U4L3D5_PYROM|nr:Similar to hypothetical protein AOL_s00076g400 [Arthrobotrys oligospora ATCC 24927]; acc. no. EGX50049 [Pyronema omphalodes CBS 100304]